jgi:cation diffusion facilitator family transporter
MTHFFATVREKLATKIWAAAVSVISNSLLILIKLLIGLLTGSVSIIAEAIHSGMDLLAAVIAFFSVRAGAKIADEEHPFGHGKIEDFSGLIEALLIFVAAVLIIYGAVKRILHPAELEMLGYGVAAMLVSVAVNVAVSRYLLKVAKNTDSIALEADARHLTTDVLTSLGVMVGVGIVWLTHIRILDPLVAIAVALLIIRTAYDLTRRSVRDLLDVKLPDAEETFIRDKIAEHKGEIVGFHGLRSRKGGFQRFVDLHLVMARSVSLEEAHRLCDHFEQEIENHFPFLSLTIHVEPCDIPPEKCRSQCPLNQKPLCYEKSEPVNHEEH